MKEIIKRKNLRIPQYNYSEEGLYFITICIQNRKCLLSNIIIDEQKNTRTINLSSYGKIIENNLIKINHIYSDIQIHDYVIMPNHIHFVVEIINTEIRKNNPANLKIPKLISGFKRITNNECKEKIWQRNYYEHIIRNEREYLEILEYMQNNPYKWEKDKYYIC